MPSSVPPKGNPDVNGGRADRGHAKVYLVGGGIASLSAAAFLIRDGDMRGRDITILAESDIIGGSLDAAGSARDGYVLRGGRMLERQYRCTFDLFASIPTLDESQTVTRETLAWNETLKTSSKSCLVHTSARITRTSTPGSRGGSWLTSRIRPCLNCWTWGAPPSPGRSDPAQDTRPAPTIQLRTPSCPISP